MRSVALILVTTLACTDDTSGEERQGGDATITDRTVLAFSRAIPDLTPDQREEHLLGRGPFAFTWTPPQLGPQFNHDACIACHAGNGRGLSEIGPSAFGSQGLIRVSQDAGVPEVPGGQVPVPELGLQLQDHAVNGLPEVNVDLGWIEGTPELSITLGDGEVVMLRAPRLVVVRGNGDPLPTGIHMSYRQALPLVGLGLLDAVSDATLSALADPDDLDGDGISGRVNIAWDAASQTMRVGRFGHKASVPRLIEQVAGAFANDMGLPNVIFPAADGMRDVNDRQLEQSAFHVGTLAVPAAAPRDGAASRGRALFDDMTCASCHLPALATGSSEVAQLAGQLIHPYTDLLLHDLGDGLGDDRGDFLAQGREWRTPPLWGIGLARLIAPDATFLHDGRARTLSEAILWHGGEANVAREAFRTASPGDRVALLAFLATL